MPKQFTTYEQQLRVLEDKGLHIPNREFAEAMLLRIGYFGLICGYKSPFKNPTTNRYMDNVSFEDIVALYSFDNKLRELFLRYLLFIERHIRSLISYSFTEKYGESQLEYLRRANFENNLCVMSVPTATACIPIVRQKPTFPICRCT